uniref:Cytochrome c oxidase polypeptide II n=1 Tax=Ananas comosus var. bracteatus TaxID=296719 RepID=A0A6V7PVR1_ANACO|nr:unnamed protein product [Ananas comosus var. bracteatus]
MSLFITPRYRPGCHLCVEGEGSNPNPLPSESPSIQSIPLEQGMTWEPTWKALPTHSWVASHRGRDSPKRVAKSVHTSRASTQPYEYSDYNSGDEQSLTFDSYTIPEDDPELGQSRLLEVDNRVVVPAKTHLRMIVTPADVPHSWAVPSSGVKCDAVPGRSNQTSISVQREGVYYGQCSEIRGTNHAFTRAFLIPAAMARQVPSVASTTASIVSTFGDKLDASGEKVFFPLPRPYFKPPRFPPE